MPMWRERRTLAMAMTVLKLAAEASAIALFIGALLAWSVAAAGSA